MTGTQPLSPSTEIRSQVPSPADLGDSVQTLVSSVEMLVVLAIEVLVLGSLLRL